MLSVSGKNWEETNINKRVLEKIKIDNNFSEIISKLILSRNFTKDEIYSIKEEINYLNPFINNNDFNQFSNVLEKNIKRKNKILIIGDYDVDGCISTSIFTYFLRSNNCSFDYFIPDRFNDGYGASLKLIKKLVKQVNPKLIIMLDCGSNSSDAIKYLNQNNIESLIIDHHNINKPYPESKVIINPKKDCDYKNFDYLCTASLTYFFLDSYIKKKKLSITIRNFDIYVLMAIICDVMPLRYFNRFFAIQALKKFDLNKDPILKKFFEILKIKRKLNVNDLGYYIGPIINSAGRISNSNVVVELFTSLDNDVQYKIINKLFLFNQKRKKIENQVIKLINLDSLLKTKGILFISNHVMSEGIVGIVASRIKDYCNKPCIVLTKKGNVFKGSARSTSDFNIGQYIDYALKKKILISGGGHNLAAGVTLNSNKLELFKKYLNEIYLKKNNLNVNFYLSRISPNSLNSKLLNEISQISPFGHKNSNPLFLIENVKIIKPTLLKEKYISCYIKTNQGKLIKVISFQPLNSNISLNLLYYKKPLNLIIKLNENNWNNKKILQIQIIDLIINFNKA